jgi:uncharacterized damage-inducible protein DinB
MIPPLDWYALISYTTWQRDLWQGWFVRQGPGPLAVTTGPHGDGRFPTVGALIRHVFSAELRYVERIADLPLTDTTSVALEDPTALFRLGEAGRIRLVQLLDDLPTAAWDVPRDFSLLGATARITPRKILLHVLTHEIRHWAQVATLIRVHGWRLPDQDLLFSPVFGDPIRLGPPGAG